MRGPRNVSGSRREPYEAQTAFVQSSRDGSPHLDRFFHGRNSTGSPDETVIGQSPHWTNTQTIRRTYSAIDTFTRRNFMVIYYLMAVALQVLASPPATSDPFNGYRQNPSLPSPPSRLSNYATPNVSDLGLKTNWMFIEYGVPLKLTKRQKLLLQVSNLTKD